MGGTVSTINTGENFIQANQPIYWEAPGNTKSIKIRGYPDDAVFPVLKVFDRDVIQKIFLEKIKDDVNDEQAKAVAKAYTDSLNMYNRIVGYSLNDAQPGHQLDIILRR